MSDSMLRGIASRGLQTTASFPFTISMPRRFVEASPFHASCTDSTSTMAIAGQPIATDDGVHVHDLETGELVCCCQNHRSGNGAAYDVAYDVAFVKNGSDRDKLLSGHGSGALRVWTVPEGESWKTLGADAASAQAYTVDVDGTGTRFCSAGSDGALRIWSLDCREPLHVLHGHRGVIHRARFLPGAGAGVATCGDDGTTRVWRSSPAEIVLDPFQRAVAIHALAFAGDGQRLAVGADDGTVVVCDLASEGTSCCKVADVGEAMRSLAFCPTTDLEGNFSEERLLALDRSGNATLIDLEKKTPIWPASVSGVLAIGPVVADGKWGIRAASANESANAGDSRFLVHRVSSADWPVLDSAGQFLALRSGDDLRRWKVSDDSLEEDASWIASAEGTTTLAVDPRGRVWAGKADGTVVAFDWRDGQLLYQLVESDKAVTSLTFNENGSRLIVCGEGGRLDLWLVPVESSKEQDAVPKLEPISLLSLGGHSEDVLAAAFCSSGRTLATADAQGLVCIRRSPPQVPNRAEKPPAPGLRRNQLPNRELQDADPHIGR